MEKISKEKNRRFSAMAESSVFLFVKVNYSVHS